MTFSSSSDEDGQERFLHQGRCRTHCPRGFYPDRGHYACLPCIANCELCTDGNICAKCRGHYKLHNGVCQTALCGIGKCKTEFLWRRYLCPTERHSVFWILDLCVSGQVQDPDTGECIDCEIGCKTCYTGKHAFCMRPTHHYCLAMYIKTLIKEHNAVCFSL